MPASKTGVLKTTGKRFNPLTRAFVKEFRKQTGIKIKYEDFCRIIDATTLKMQDAIANDDAGLELPQRLGHIVVTKYKSTKRATDWKNSKALGKSVPLLNLHSHGYIHHIKWFIMGCRFHYRYIYKFRPMRPLARAVAHNVKSGKLYQIWQNTDFWSTTSMERTYEKFYKNK